MDYVLMFLVNFVAVFLLGLQSRNVNAGHYSAAVVTSFFISVSNFMFVKYAAHGDIVTFFVCAAGGCCGIAFSIWFYQKIFHKFHGVKNDAA